MSTLTLRNLDPEIEAKLRDAAAAHARTFEDEARAILRDAFAPPMSARGLGSRIHARFAALGGVELQFPQRR